MVKIYEGTFQTVFQWGMFHSLYCYICYHYEVTCSTAAQNLAKVLPVGHNELLRLNFPYNTLAV